MLRNWRWNHGCKHPASIACRLVCRQRWRPSADMRIAELAGQRVAVWGFGREGRAAIRAIRQRAPGLALALYCSQAEAAEAQAFDADLRIYPNEPDAVALSAYDVVVKSPGISA